MLSYFRILSKEINRKRERRNRVTTGHTKNGV